MSAGSREVRDVQRGLRGASADITWPYVDNPRAPRVVREYRVRTVECNVREHMTLIIVATFFTRVMALDI
jgi:hypothetical protein